MKKVRVPSLPPPLSNADDDAPIERPAPRLPRRARGAFLGESQKENDDANQKRMRSSDAAVHRCDAETRMERTHRARLRARRDVLHALACERYDDRIAQ